MPSNFMLLSAAAFVTTAILLIGDAIEPTVQHSSATTCTRWQQAHVEQALLTGTEGDSGLEPASAAALGGVASDALRRAGWRSGVQFARFEPAATLEGVLKNSWAYAGSYLLIVTGNASMLARRDAATPFFAVHPSSGSLAAVLTPATAALNTLAGSMEAALGRRLFPFQLETAPLPACAAGSGPCAVWEAGSGRVVMDAGLAGKLVAAATAGGGPTVVASHQHSAAASGSGTGSGTGSGSDGGSSSSTSGGGGGLSALLAAFVDELAQQAQQAGELLKSGEASLRDLAALFAKAGAAAVTLLMASQVPLWFCIACPLVLGMLAPFLFNFGLTAAAEALCAQLQLPDQTCTDLWWGAFALALVLSLGAAVPIVYVCHLPECGRRSVAAAAAGGATAVARLLARS